MNLVLTGFMGTGKSAVGRRIADTLKAPFIDVDTAIQNQAGLTIAKIFETRGEAAFRALEHSVIAELSQKNRTVIATGGGALLDPANRENLCRNGYLICLTARVGTLLERLRGDSTRPLLAGEKLEDRVERLFKERESVYAQCPVQIATDGRTIAEVADEILEKSTKAWNA